MFCSECGVEAKGKFCWSCGHALIQPIAAESSTPTSDWRTCIDYETLIRVPEVRERIAQAAAACKNRVTGEEFLECCDKVLTPVTGGMPLAVIRKIAQPISEKLGIKSTQSRSERFAQPPGEVLVTLLCSFASKGQSLVEARTAAGACSLQATIPANIWFLEGFFDVTVRAAENITVVDATITIPGQLYDWGKGRRCLDEMIDSISALAQCA